MRIHSGGGSAGPGCADELFIPWNDASALVSNSFKFIENMLIYSNANRYSADKCMRHINFQYYSCYTYPFWWWQRRTGLC